MVLLFNARASTKDVDASRVAAARHLPSDWLNDAAKGDMHGLSLGRALLQTPSLTVHALAPEQLLAMKLCAWRDDTDVEDARVLLRHLGSERLPSWHLIEPYSSLAASSRLNMLSMTYGRPSMELADLVWALRAFDSLAAREWVQYAARARLDWSTVPEPAGLDAEARAIAAGVVEMLAARAGVSPPSWTRAVPAAPQELFLVRAAADMPRLRATCENEGPESLRRRRIFAPPEFLTFA